MPALIGYLVAIAVFLGGGYAGLQWLTTPDDIPPAVMAKQSGVSTKSSAARLIASRKKNAAEAERLANAPQGEAGRQSSTQDRATQSPAVDVPPVQMGEGVPSAPKAAVAVAVAPSETPAPPTVDAQTQQPDMTSLIKAEIANETAAVEQNDKLLAARAEIDRQTAATLKESVSGKEPVSGDSHPSSATSSPPSRPVERKTVEPKAIKTRAASVDTSDAPKKPAAVKRKPAVAQLEKPLRKPVMMILRTIEFADGHREQRLLPMSRSPVVSMMVEDDF